jgi:hypothetical protein
MFRALWLAFRRAATSGLAGVLPCLGSGERLALVGPCDLPEARAETAQNRRTSQGST